MAYEALAISIFVILVLVALIVFIALLYSIYWENHDSTDDSDVISERYENLQNRQTDVKTFLSDIQYPGIVVKKRRTNKKDKRKEISIAEQLKLNKGKPKPIIEKPKCNLEKNELKCNNIPGVMNITSNSSLSNKIENNKLLVLDGTNKYKVTLPSDNIDGLTLNFFNKSSYSQQLSSNKHIMDDRESVLNKDINSGQFMSLMFNGEFWIIVNKFGGSIDTEQIQTNITNLKDTIQTKFSSITTNVQDKVMSIEEQLQSLLSDSSS